VLEALVGPLAMMRSRVSLADQDQIALTSQPEADYSEIGKYKRLKQANSNTELRSRWG